MIRKTISCVAGVTFIFTLPLPAPDDSDMDVDLVRSKWATEGQMMQRKGSLQADYCLRA